MSRNTRNTQQSNPNAIQDYVNEAIAALKDELMISIKSEVLKGIEVLKTKDIADIKKENVRLKRIIHDLEDEMEITMDKIYDLECAVNEQQQRSRRNNLEIHGLPNNISDEDLEKNCINLLNLIVEDEIVSSEIDACHRLPSKNNYPKPVIMRFVHRKRRDELIEKGKTINNNNLSDFGITENRKVYINQNLSPTMKSLFYHCRCLRRENKITKVSFDNSKLKIKMNDNSRWRRIQHEDEIRDLFPNYNFGD